jgi:ABC-type transport system involved in multi-copper enzyme maturation permease subunit
MDTHAAANVKPDVWTRIFRLAGGVLFVGALLGGAAHFLLDREFRNDELGILLWPLTAIYLLSFFYVLTFLVFTSVKSRLRYIVIPLWFLMMFLMVGALVSLAFTKGGKGVEQDGPANGSQPIRPEIKSTSGAAGSRR